jgi:hypothetical protein
MAVKYFAWDDAKNARLRAGRGIGFPDRYAGQRIFVVRREDYVYLVPFPPSPATARRELRRGLAVALRAEADVEDEHTGLAPQRAKSARRGPRGIEDDHPEPEGHEGAPR